MFNCVLICLGSAAPSSFFQGNAAPLPSIAVLLRVACISSPFTDRAQLGKITSIFSQPKIFICLISQESFSDPPDPTRPPTWGSQENLYFYCKFYFRRVFVWSKAITSTKSHAIVFETRPLLLQISKIHPGASNGAQSAF